MKRSVGIAALCALALLTSPSTAADFKKGALITIPATFDLKASPSAVWTAVTSWEGFGALTGFQPTGPEKTFSRVGDSVAARVWDDRGTLVVTGFSREKELRVTWEPGNASYLCGKRVVLAPSAGGTKLE